MMSKEEQQATGVSTLTPPQKAALANWIDSNYTQKPIPSTPTQLYLSVNIQNGKQLLLSDGSLWAVNPNDVSTTALWITPFPLTLKESGDPNYPYEMTNQNSLEIIRVKRISSATGQNQQ